jgi:hypothetical protein
MSARSFNLHSERAGEAHRRGLNSKMKLVQDRHCCCTRQVCKKARKVKRRRRRNIFINPDRRERERERETLPHKMVKHNNNRKERRRYYKKNDTLSLSRCGTSCNLFSSLNGEARQELNNLDVEIYSPFQLFQPPVTTESFPFVFWPT